LITSENQRKRLSVFIGYEPGRKLENIEEIKIGRKKIRK